VIDVRMPTGAIDDRTAMLFSGHDPARVEAFSRRFGPFARTWFRYRLRGLERVPPPPCVFVANHSGFGTYEIPCMIAAWHAHFGRGRPVHGLAHGLGIRSPVWGTWLRAMGALPASMENARATLEAGRDVIVFPGGDVDACRPFYQARKVVFGSRRGYARLALAANVPIVPLATIGSHYTVLMAPGGALLARAFGLKRLLRLERVPLPIGWMIAAAAVVAGIARLIPAEVALGVGAIGAAPVPARVTTDALTAIDPRAAGGEGPEAERVERVHDRVFGALAGAVAHMSHRQPQQTAS
jgi:1-acyl-sn-glycerol-3-phosphate acyltransferase